MSSSSSNEKSVAGKKALEGLKVVEYSQFISGPYCGKLLGDLGAEVIKIEEPGAGDRARAVGPFLNDTPHHERSGLFSYLNTSKLGITLDVKTVAGKKIFHQLLNETDILVENNPPKLMKRWGLDYKNLSKVNPRLIMTSITPFGQTGPYRDYKACELITYHASGVGYTTPKGGEASQEPLKTAGRLTEFYAGQNGALATMCAVLARETTKKGQHVDVSVQEAFLNNFHGMLTFFMFDPTVLGAVVRWGNPRAVMGIFPCKDGHASFQFMTEEQWQGFVEVMGNPEWAENELFKDQNARRENWDAVKLLMEEWLSGQNKQEFFHAAQAKRCPVAPVNTIEEVLNDKHLAARGFFVDIEHPEIGKAKYPSAPYKFSETPWRVERPAPLLGQHNEEIYCRRLGYTKKDLVKMRGAGII